MKQTKRMKAVVIIRRLRARGKSGEIIYGILLGSGVFGPEMIKDAFGQDLRGVTVKNGRVIVDKKPDYRRVDPGMAHAVDRFGLHLRV